MKRSLTFKSMYWSYEDMMDENKLIIHVSGMTKDQKTVQIQIENFTPYVYLELPKKVKWTKEKCNKLFGYFQSTMKNSGPLTYKFQKKNMLECKREFLCMFLTFPTHKSLSDFNRKCSSKNFVPGIGMLYQDDLLLHEHNIDPIIKYASIKNILLANWITVTENIHEDEVDLSEDERKFSMADIDMYVDWRKVEPYTPKETIILNPLYCSFDIECYSKNHNSKLPDPKEDENVVFQISMYFGRMGDSSYHESYLLSLFDPLPIDDSTVLKFKTEKELLLKFSKIIREKDPMIFIGYNIMKFDWDYMIARAEKFGYLMLFLDISRIVGKKAKVCTVKWNSSAYKDQEFRFPDCFGRIQMDAILEIERNYRLPIYSLNAVAENFLGEKKDDITPRQLFMFYKITNETLHLIKDDLDSEELKNIQKQIKSMLPLRKTHGVVRRHRRKMMECTNVSTLKKLVRECLTMTLRYCKQDTILPIKLIGKLNLLTTMEEMSNVMHVPMSYLHTRGQQIKVLAQVYRDAMSDGLVIPYNKKDPQKKKEHYEGAIVAEAHAGDYNNVGTLDFCLAGDTLISTGNGYSVPLKNIADDDKVIGWDGTSFGEYSSQGVVYKGEKETVKVWLQDGTTIVATPDHKFMLDNGEWCRADELVGKYVKCGIGQPEDRACEKEKGWELDLEGICLDMKTKKNREDALAFSRLLGYILSDGSIYVTTDKKGRTRKCCEVSMGTMIDAMDIMKDIVRFDREVNIRKRGRGIKGTTYCITIPAKLSKAIHSIENIVVGKRATQPMKLPSFVLDEKCPLSIIREFLAGLFGGDGTAPYKDKSSSSFGHMSFKWTTIEKYKDEMNIVFNQIQNMLLKFHINSNRFESKIKYKETSIKPKNIEGDNHRWDILITIPTDFTSIFQETIGFRYCINKCAKLTIVNSFYKMREKIRDQNSRIFNEVNSLILSSELKIKEALEISRKKIFSNEPPLCEQSLSSVNEILYRRGEHKRHPDRPKNLSLKELTTSWFLQETNTKEWFSTQKEKKYAVSSDSEIIPSFRKKVIGVFKDEIVPVYDILNVDKVHNFLAGGVQASNCSLYPTTIIAFNICYSTLIKDKSVPNEECNILEWTSHIGCPHDPLKRKKKIKDQAVVICGDFRCKFRKVKISYDEKTKTVIREHEGVLPRLERNLLTSRKEVKYEMFKAQARLEMNRGKSSAEEIVVYKKCGFEIIEKGSLSAEEDQILEVLVGVLNAKQLAIKVSANSTDAKTPVLCLENGIMQYRNIEDLFVEKTFQDEKNNELCASIPKIKVWSDGEWAKVKCVIRHHLSPNEQLYKIDTQSASVVTTKHHSLLDLDGEPAKTEETQLGDCLLHSDLPIPKDTPSSPRYSFLSNNVLESHEFLDEEENFFLMGIYFSNNYIPQRAYNILDRKWSGDMDNFVSVHKHLFVSDKNHRVVPHSVYTATHNCRLAFLLGVYAGTTFEKTTEIKNKGHISSAGLFLLLESLGYSTLVKNIKDDEYVLSFGSYRSVSYITKKSMVTSTDDYVYDIETSTHHFGAGVGDMVVHNSAYGAMGADQGFIPLISGAASVTAMGRKLITMATGKIRDTWSNCKIIYGDSVTGNTPIMIRDGNSNLVHIIKIEDLSKFVRGEWEKFPLFKKDGDTSRRDKNKIEIGGVDVWTDKGWRSIKKLIRHRVNKKIYRVQTENSIIDVTEDHSLIRENGELLKPGNASIDDGLLFSFPDVYTCENIYKNQENMWWKGFFMAKNIIEENSEENIPFYIINGDRDEQNNFLGGYMYYCGTEIIKAKSEVVTQQLYYLLKSIGCKNLEVFKIDEVYCIRICKYTRKRNLITSIEVLYETYDDYVYDIETSSGRFNAGIGELTIKNTDSCMLIFDGCSLKESFENCEKASKIVTHYLKCWILGVDENYQVKSTKGDLFLLNKINSKSKEFEDLSYDQKIKVLEYESIPTDLSFETMYERFLLLTKKRYIAYTINKDGVITGMTKKGVVLTRRDNSQYLRTTYKKVSDGILNQKDELNVMYELYDEIHKLFTRQVPDTSLIIYLGIKKIMDYAKKEKFYIGGKYHEFHIDKNKDPIDEPVGALDPRLVYPNLPQVLLALKLTRRGTDIPANTRLEHIYLENKDAIHQGEKAEDYTYYKENRDVEGFKIDFLHYIKSLMAPITELINVKYPRRDRILYEKIEDAAARIIRDTGDIDEYKRSTLARLSIYEKNVNIYKIKGILCGWDAYEKLGKNVQKFIRRSSSEPKIYKYKGIDAKVEYILESYKKGGINSFSMNNEIEKEMIYVSGRYKARIILNKLYSQYKIKKRPFKKPTQTGEKLIKNTGVYFISGEYKGRYGFVNGFTEIESQNSKKKKYNFSILLEEEGKIVEDIPRESITSYYYRDNSVMKDIYNARFFYKSMVEELNDIFNPVKIEE